ncbi:MAG: NAD-dependent epimerase/dehydratase family protein [Nitrospiraceae bacterium]|nr:NAD-dependent epimerase/dehydratase family protein [Nitrospiraceae bacterium]
MEGTSVLITGGAGFIGSNLAEKFLSMGRQVHILDNLSRAGVERNLLRLKEKYGGLLGVDIADLRNFNSLRRAVSRAEAVFHLAAQVAVTTSLTDPAMDFEVNARGTLNLLEAVRSAAQVSKRPAPPIIFTSTNKVYGALEDMRLAANGTRYLPESPEVLAFGVNEKRPLAFHSPYGCSKGAADQYVLDYAKTFGLTASVFRMSCIYGPHQMGTEDQGWVAHFLISAIEGRAITIYGDGKQVRDVLFVGDLVDAFLLGLKHIEKISGRAFNIGGGPGNSLSILEFLDLIEEVRGERPEVFFAGWRRADQKYFISDTRNFTRATGWAPRTDVITGVGRLHDWLMDSLDHGSAIFAEKKTGDVSAGVGP